jgi:hypothetical protein
MLRDLQASSQSPCLSIVVLDRPMCLVSLDGKFRD